MCYRINLKNFKIFSLMFFRLQIHFIKFSKSRVNRSPNKSFADWREKLAKNCNKTWKNTTGNKNHVYRKKNVDRCNDMTQFCKSACIIWILRREYYSDVEICTFKMQMQKAFCQKFNGRRIVLCMVGVTTKSDSYNNRDGFINIQTFSISDT